MITPLTFPPTATLRSPTATTPARAASRSSAAISSLSAESPVNSFSNWSSEEVDTKLHNIMKRIHKTCVDTAAEYGDPGNYVLGANIAGFMKVANSMIDQGLV